MSDSVAEVARDLRRNVADEQGRSWYAYDERHERVVLGPYGSREYAVKCAERSNYPEKLAIASARTLT